jgi:predicted nucleic acid-binding protein
LGRQPKGKKGMSRRIVVCDTGPLLHLAEADALTLLELAGEVNIPSVVAAEFENNAIGRQLPGWIQIVPLDAVSAEKAQIWASHIDPGESAAIALSVQLKADWLLSDDARARQFAESLGVEVHGSIGLLLWAAATGHIPGRDQALNLLDALAASSLWVSDRVLRYARKTIDSLF